MALLLLAAQLSLLVGLVLRPVAVSWVEPTNLVLFATIEATVAQGPRTAALTLGGWLLTTAPLGVLLPLLGRQLGGTRFASLTRTVFTGAMIALGCELLRSAAPSQTADVDRLLTATIGIAVTHLLCYGPLRRLRSTGHATPPATAAPGPGWPLPEWEALAVPSGKDPRDHRVAVRRESDASFYSLPLR